jgi:hypothetical protein
MPGKVSPAMCEMIVQVGAHVTVDRIALHIEVPPVKFREMSGERTGETSAQICERPYGYEYLVLCHSCKLTARQCRLIQAISRSPSLGCMTRRLNYKAECLEFP